MKLKSQKSYKQFKKVIREVLLRQAAHEKDLTRQFNRLILEAVSELEKVLRSENIKRGKSISK